MAQRIVMVTAATVAALLSPQLMAHIASDTATKEKCYGVAPIGQNDCANLSGTHSCAGQAKVANDVTEWKYVAKGTCSALGGLLTDQAKAKLKS